LCCGVAVQAVPKGTRPGCRQADDPPDQAVALRDEVPLGAPATDGHPNAERLAWLVMHLVFTPTLA
jgi:hypothetical protein